MEGGAQWAGLLSQEARSRGGGPAEAVNTVPASIARARNTTPAGVQQNKTYEEQTEVRGEGSQYNKIT